MIRHSLTFRAKLLVILGLAIATTAAGKAIFHISGEEQRIGQEIANQAKAAADQGAKSLATAVWELNRDQALQILGGLALHADFRFAVITDHVGGVFVHLGARSGRPNADITATADINHANAGDQRQIGKLTIGLSRDRVAIEQRQALMNAVGGATVDFAFVFLAALIAVSFVSRPMEAITAAMLRVAEGRVDNRTPHTDRRDQLGQLAQAVELFRSEIGRRMQVEEDLRTIHSKLEKRIDDRTAELRLLNEELARAAKERERAEQRLIDAINSIPDGFVLYDPEDRLVLCNGHYRTIYTYLQSMDDLRGLTFEEITRPVTQGYLFDCEAQASADAWLQRRIEHHRLAPIEPFTLHLADGRWIQINERRTKEGGYVSVCVDVTEQRKVMTALEHSESKFRGLLAASPDALLAIDRTGVIAIANRQTESLFGYRQEELAGLPLRALVPERFRKNHSSLVAQYFTRRAARSMGGDLELLALRKDGSEFPVEISLSPYDAADETLVLAAVRDISARKEAEEALRRVQKMEALGTLAGGIAHDLNNTLVPIVGLTELTADALPEGSSERDNLHDVLGAALRAKELVRQILAFSRAEKQAHAQIDLATTVRESLRLLRSAIPPTVTLRAQIPDQPVLILGNETQIHQVMLNLCGNAAQALGDRPSATIEVRLDTSLDAWRNAGGEHRAHFARLSVIDNGSGMDKATQERIFEPFFTTKGVGEGTGLGLAVVHGVVHSHHGRITVDSGLGKGTRFDVFLPIHDSNPSPVGVPRVDAASEQTQHG